MTEGERLFLQGKTDEAYEILQKEGSGRSCYMLGLIDREGYGHHKADEEKSREWFQKGKEMGDPLCGISLFHGETGKDMWDTVNQDFSRILLAANQGDVLAMDEAGLSYLGNGMILNFEEGLKWLAKAALFEYWKALYDLGMAYMDGYAAVPDEAKAVKCLEQAASFGHSESEYELGKWEFDRENAEKAIQWMKKSYEHGNAEAALFLGNYYEGQTDGNPKDAEEAFHWYENAARMGEGEAMAELSFFYEQGIVVEKDDRKAEYLLKDAITLGYKDAFFSLALFYLDRKKETEAFTYMEAAAKGGSRRALYMTGMMYLYGQGTEPDRNKGIEYLKDAAEMGEENAEQELRNQGIFMDMM